MDSNFFTEHEPDILVRGQYRVDLGNILGQQEIQTTLLKRAADGDYECVIADSIRESGARHMLISGVLASAIFTDVRADNISLPSGSFTFTRRDVPREEQPKALGSFAQLRKASPDQNHLMVCATSPEIASESGLFDLLPEADKSAAIFVIGYGMRYSNLVANFYRCVNVPGKARGFVHSIVSLYDSTRVVNQDYDALVALADPIKQLRYFWDMESLRWEAPPMPKLLEITAI